MCSQEHHGTAVVLLLPSDVETESILSPDQLGYPFHTWSSAFGQIWKGDSLPNNSLFTEFATQSGVQGLLENESIIHNLAAKLLTVSGRTSGSDNTNQLSHLLIIRRSQGTTLGSLTMTFRIVLHLCNSTTKCSEGVTFGTVCELFKVLSGIQQWVVITDLPQLPQHVYNVSVTHIWYLESVAEEVKNFLEQLQERSSSDVSYGNHCLLPDLRIAHLAQLPSLIQLIKENNGYQFGCLGRWKARHPTCQIIAYLLVPNKTKRLHLLGVLNSTKEVIYVPIHPSLPIKIQLQQISIRPDLFLFKISDYLGTLPSKGSQYVIRSLLNYFASSSIHCQSLQRLPSTLRFPSVTLGTPFLNSSGILEKRSLRIVASLDCQRLLLDRFHFLQLLDHAASVVNSESSSSNAILSVAPYVCLDFPLPNTLTISQALSSKGLTFPMLAKLRLGGGPPASHIVGPVFSMHGLLAFAANVYGEEELNSKNQLFIKIKDVTLDSKAVPEDLKHLAVRPGILLQHYVPHEGDLVFKVFVIGDWIQIKSQLSIPNLDNLRKGHPLGGGNIKITTGDDFLYFNSGALKVTSENCQMTLKLSQNGNFEKITEDSEDNQAVGSLFSLIDQHVICRISLLLTWYLGTPTFGFDVLIKTNNGRSSLNDQLPELVLVDINYLPSFSGVRNLPYKFTETLTRLSLSDIK